MKYRTLDFPFNFLPNINSINVTFKMNLYENNLYNDVLNLRFFSNFSIYKPPSESL